jgi:hypothetical protein
MAIGFVFRPPGLAGTLPATGIFNAARAACIFPALGPAGVAGGITAVGGGGVGSVRCSTWSRPNRTYTSDNMIRHPIISSVLVSFICLNVIFFYRVLNNWEWRHLQKYGEPTFLRRITVWPEGMEILVPKKSIGIRRGKDVLLQPLFIDPTLLFRSIARLLMTYQRV